MTPQEAINWIRLDIEMAKFDPSTGEEAYLNDDAKKVIEALELAIEALEKQIPMKMMEELDISGRPIRVCGNCGDAPGNGEFCRWCGQKIRR